MTTNTLRILHTSDWHLGRLLYGRKRYEEFTAFLDWLAEVVAQQNINILLIAGDIFDTATPSNRAQELYYNFLKRMSSLPECRHVVVIGGNHDSPSLLNAPKNVLQAINVHVVGAMSDKPEDEVITLYSNQGMAEALICAVPYLRDKDIRKTESGEHLEDKDAKLLAGLRDHYAEICMIAEEKRVYLQQKQGNAIPMIAMGHLFAAGSKTVEGDGVRDLYVGNLAHVGSDIFPPYVDYVALGHLHVPQRVGDCDHIRYCGSPIPMGYGEAKQQKRVLSVMFEQEKSTPVITDIDVPCFQKLERISGDKDDIITGIHALKTDNSTAWLEVVYTGDVLLPNLREIIDEAAEDSSLEILRVKNKRLADRAATVLEDEETLEDIDINTMFSRCLDAHALNDETERAELTACYEELAIAIEQADERAE